MMGEAKPKEGGVAAFFDLDGTLVPGPSLEWRFFRELRKNHRIPFINYLRWTSESLRLLPRGILAVQHENKHYLAGVCRDLIFRHMGSIAFFEEGIARVVWHTQQGHSIFLVSGTLEALAQMAATALECELEARGVQLRPRIFATDLKEMRGRWTGEIDGQALYGRSKAQLVKAIAAQAKMDLRLSYAYGNSLLDRHFLCAVGHGHAVNPRKQLAALANQKNWTVWHWHQEKKIISAQNSFASQEIHPSEGPA
ncbi:MAG: HAD-IB family phosphatase [Candidatus Acidiferrum sp.]|jgi:HAD superfamily phosphoserine phosphatase-like hydrolase